MSITPCILVGPRAVQRLLLDQVAGSECRCLQKPNIWWHSGSNHQRVAMSKCRKDRGQEVPWTSVVTESLAVPQEVFQGQLSAAVSVCRWRNEKLNII